MANVDIDLGKYSLGWSDPEESVFKPEKGLNEEIIRKMSSMKNEPKWMLDFRLKSYKRFLDKPLPCLLYTSPSPRDRTRSRMPSSA